MWVCVKWCLLRCDFCWHYNLGMYCNKITRSVIFVNFTWYSCLCSFDALVISVMIPFTTFVNLEIDSLFGKPIRNTKFNITSYILLQCATAPEQCNKTIAVILLLSCFQWTVYADDGILKGLLLPCWPFRIWYIY